MGAAVYSATTSRTHALDKSYSLDSTRLVSPSLLDCPKKVDLMASIALNFGDILLISIQILYSHFHLTHIFTALLVSVRSTSVPISAQV